MYCVEKVVGKVSITKSHLFVRDIFDMQELEFWERRLDQLKENYAICYRKSKANNLIYSIFLNYKKSKNFYK
jgi:hypothetical protein